MPAIQNIEQLINNAQNPSDRRARELALKSLEAALDAARPEQIIRSRVRLEDHVLKVDSHSFDLKKFKHIYVVGGGKATGAMAEGLEQVLDGLITDGLVNVPHGTTKTTRIVKLHGASHPIPDDDGVEGTKQMLRMVQEAREDDLIVCLISGGGSSLMPLPRGDVSLADKKRITDALLKSGARINEINTVRKHISDFKGGWLAKKAYPATILNLILSDVMGDPLDFIASGPTVPDSTTFSEAVNVLKKHELWSRTPASIKKLLSEGKKGLTPETPKADDNAFKEVYNVVVGNNRYATHAACKCLEASKLNAIMLTSTLEGEAKQVGIVLGSIAQEVSVSGNPVCTPGGIVAGGETTVVVTGKGKGGRNQEIALSAAQKIKGMTGIAIASLATDGVDGPTDAAGAIVDGVTIPKTDGIGLRSEEYLANNDSYRFFYKIEDLIFTGPTGTNVNDVSVIVIVQNSRGETL